MIAKVFHVFTYLQISYSSLYAHPNVRSCTTTHDAPARFIV